MKPASRRPGFAVDPEALVNLDEQQLRQALGPPASVREEPPAVIWRYANGHCRLDVYFYQSLNTRKLRALTYVVETTRRDLDARRHCLRRTN